MLIGLKQQYAYIIGNMCMWSLLLLSDAVDCLENEMI